jgi:hypothetical protein
MPGVLPIRASDDDRDRIIRVLRDAVVDGRLSHESFVTRVDEALRARESQPLGELVADLEPGPPPTLAVLRSRLAKIRRRLAPDREIAPDLAVPGPRPFVLIIGRRSSCDVVLSDRRVSRMHAVLTLLGERWLVTDLRSTNGTYLNGARVQAAAMVQPGDHLSFGGLTLRFAPAPLEGVE